MKTTLDRPVYQSQYLFGQQLRDPIRSSLRQCQEELLMGTHFLHEEIHRFSDPGKQLRIGIDLKPELPLG